MSDHRVIRGAFFGALLIVAVRANEALDLLESTSASAPNVYQTAARVKPSGNKVAQEKPAFPKFDATLPERWDPELPAWLSHEFRDGTTIAARGLFQYGYQGHNLGRGARLSRARLGLAVQTYYGIQLAADGLFSSEGQYEGLETLALKVPLSSSLELTAGKFRIPFSSEFTRDASVRWFSDLSPFVAQIAPPNSLGAMLRGQGNHLEWKLGWFSSDIDRNIPKPDASGLLLAGLSYQQNRGGSETSSRPNYQRWHFDYFYNPDPGGLAGLSRSYRHLFSTGFEYSADSWDFRTDLIVGRGSGQNAFAASAAGAYWLLPGAVRFVTRYQVALSEEDGGILSGWGIPDSSAGALQPFDYPVITPAGQLISVYGGLNFHLYEDALIVASGLEYRSLADVVEGRDFDSWGWNASVRLAF